MKKFFKILLCLSLSSCSGCEDKQEEDSKRPRISFQPDGKNILNFVHITEEQASDPDFWQKYEIDKDWIIFPVEEKIVSVHWKEYETVLIALMAFLSVKNNVRMLNQYKNQTTLSKLVFFISHNINNKQNIDLYAPLFYQEFTERLKKLYPDDYVDILQNPIELESVFQGMIVDDTLEKNPGSKNQVQKYKIVHGYHSGPIIRKFFYLPVLDENIQFCDQTYFDFLCIIFEDNGLQEKLLLERKNFLTTGKEPHVDALLSDIKKLSIQKMAAPLKMVDTLMSGMQEVNDLMRTKLEEYVAKKTDIIKKQERGIESYLKELIKGGTADFYYDYGSKQRSEILKEGEDRYYIEANDGAYVKSFGNEKLKNYPFYQIHFDLDAKKFKKNFFSVDLMSRG